MPRPPTACGETSRSHSWSWIFRMVFIFSGNNTVFQTISHLSTIPDFDGMSHPKKHNKHSKYNHFYLLIQFSGSCNQNDKPELAITSHLHNGKGGHYSIQGRKICPRNASHLPLFILHLQKCNSLWNWAFPCRSIKVANCASAFSTSGNLRVRILWAQVNAFVCITNGRK